MNHIEYKEVLKTVSINNPLSRTIGGDGSMVDVHYWNELAIWFEGKYAIIHGKIPIDVANTIYEKYPDNPYGIRVNGGGKDWKPTDFVKENKYIESYHIDTKDGLLIFLIEMKEYSLRNNMDETEEEYDKSTARIVSELLKSINPTISADKWMQEDKQNRDIYNASLKRTYKTRIGRLFRDAIIDFDTAVNPFIDKSIEFDKPINYLKKVYISGNVYSSNFRNECCDLRIFDNKTNNYTTYVRLSDGFAFSLKYSLNENELLQLTHCFSRYSTPESENGEYLLMNYYRNNESKTMRYNITNGNIVEKNNDQKPITLDEFTFLYDKLIEATSYASRITIENMKKETKEIAYTKR